MCRGLWRGAGGARTGGSALAMPGVPTWLWRRDPLCVTPSILGFAQHPPVLAPFGGCHLRVLGEGVPSGDREPE